MGWCVAGELGEGIGERECGLLLGDFGNVDADAENDPNN